MPLLSKMLRYFLKIYFIFVLYIIFFNVRCISQENGATEKEILGINLPTQGKGCESRFCSCAGFSEVDGVYCKDSISEISYIKFHHFKHLPAKRFLGFRIKHLILTDPNITVDENFLEGTISLDEFEVQQSSIQTIPNFRTVKDSIQKIKIDSSHLTSLVGNNLQNLTSVTVLSFSHNYVRGINRNFFKGTKEVKILDLSYNFLTSIPPRLLNPMKNLEVFSASHNNLLHVNHLFSFTVPKKIHLDFNSINSTYSVMRRSDGDFSKALSSNRTFFKEVVVDFLDLSHNFIKDTPESCFRDTLAFGKRIIKVGHLLLLGNELQSLNICMSFFHIWQITAERNEIQYLSAEDFEFVYDVLRLDFRKNQIRRIDRDTFQSVRGSLYYLNLQSNHITSINGSIRDLPLLKELYLSENSIQTIEEDEFTGLYELYRLFLSNNKMKSLGQLQRVQLPRLLQLNIENNNITFIRSDNMHETWRTLKFLSFVGNPFKCDCRLQPLLDWLKGNKSIKTDSNLCFRSNLSPQKSPNCPDMCSCKCASDGDDSFMFVDCSSRKLTVVPQLLRNKVTQMEVNETISSDDGRLLVIDEKAYPSYIEDRVLGINLTNNSLEFLDEAQLPPNLNQLYLSNNKLRWLPESLLVNQRNLKNVSLSGNPWICNCSTYKLFKKLLTSRINIKDINNITCGISDEGETSLTGRVIWELTDFDLCPMNEQHSTHVGLFMSVCFAVLTIIILCLAAKLLYAKYELDVKVFFYYHGFPSVKDEDLNSDKEFDAFVSFSHDDDAFVIQEIIAEVEKQDPHIRLCLHYRHFLAGEYIVHNIFRAVQNSKRTVLILSRNFFESDWCLMEFRAAHTQSLEDKMHRLIMVKVGDIPKNIDPTVKIYLDNTTYLSWGEHNFFKKLLFILPSPSRARNPLPRDLRDSDLVSRFSSHDS